MELTPWFKHYDEGVPRTLRPYPERTLLDYIADSARERPDHPAILFKGLRVTYGELERLSDAFAVALAGLGVKKGDRVALLLPNSPQFIIAEVGAWKAGATVFPLNPIYTESELEGPLNNCAPETIVTLTLFYNRVKSIQPNTKLKRVIASNIKDFLPPVLRFLFTLVKEKKEGHRITLQPGDFWFSDLLKITGSEKRPSVPVTPDDPAIILLSGGTTGTPKGTVGTHRSLVISGLQMTAWVKNLKSESEDIIMLPLPLFHVYANAGIQCEAFVNGNTLSLIPNPRDIKDVLHAIRKDRPTFFISVPTLFIALLNHPDVKAGKVDFKSIKLCISGAAPLMAETKKSFEELTGGRILEGYSLTEAMMACTVNPALGVKKIGSIGMPLPDVEARIVDPDEGNKILPAGEVGEILLRAPQLMQGYWQNPEETAGVLRVHGEGGPWLHTGDLGYMDEDGYIFIVDRKKDVIKPSGFQVWPREVEEVISSHPAGLEVGVAGVPDDYQGEAVKAWVVLRSGKQVTTDEIRQYCRQKLAPYKVPKHIEFREGLPKSMVGKVLRRLLAEEERAKRG
ncbi:MAG: long-chain-fatty-acid--CoA ligase [Deltaproteobacteria bacterium]